MNSFIRFIHNYPFIVVLVSFTIGYLFMPVVHKIAQKYNFVVSPNKRSSHEGAVPNVGGINIFISFFITGFLLSFDFFSSAQFLLMGLIVILIVGFIDDLIAISVSKKLVGQFISAFFLIIVADIRLTHLHGFLGINEIPMWFSYLLSLFVFVAIINAINLIDGIDGLASGLGALYSLFFAVYFWLTGHIRLSIVAFAMLGSLAVFFMYNVFSKKMKIFMGDSGSLLLGYFIVVFVFLFNEMNINGDIPELYSMKAAPAVLFTLLIVPLFDTMRVMLTRIKKGNSPFKADRNHLHHLLLSLGYKHREVSFLLIGSSFFFLIFALLLRNWSNEALAGLTTIFCILLTKCVWVQVDKSHARKEKSVTKKGSQP